MKKILIILILPLIFILASEAFSIQKDQIIDRWAASYIQEKTSDINETKERIAAAEDIQGKLIPETSVACIENLSTDIAYIRDIPRSRLPVVNTLNSNGKIFAINTAVSNNTIAHGGSSGYWTETTMEFDREKSLTEIEASSYYKEWWQQRKEEIMTLEFLYQPPETLPHTPEGITDDIYSHSFDAPFFERHFLTFWDRYAKERAEIHYTNYMTHIEEDDIIKASVDLYELYGIWLTQDIVLDFNFSENSEFKSLIIFEFEILLILSCAATLIVYVVLFYRRNPEVLSGIPLGFVTALISPSYFVFLLFAAAGILSVFVSYRLYKNLLDYRKSVIVALKSGFILFFAYIVFRAVLSLSGVIQSESQELTSSSVESFIIMGGTAVFQLLLLSSAAAVGGMLAHKVLKYTYSDKSV